MTTSSQQDQATVGVEHQRLIVWNVVFDPLAVLFDLNPRSIIFLGINSRHGTSQPDARKNLVHLVVFDEFAAARFKLLLHRNHRVRSTDRGLELAIFTPS